MLDHVPIGMAFFDRANERVRANGPFAAMPDLPEDVRRDVERVFETRRAIRDREVVTEDGRSWLVSHFPVIVEDEVLWVGAIATEVTAARRAEQERDDLLTAERRARAGAERLAQRLARLQAITARLSAAADVDEVATVVCDHGAAGLGASGGGLVVITGDGNEVELARQVGYGAAVAESYRRFSLHAPLPVCDAIRNRSMVLLGDLAERDRRYPALAEHKTGNQAHAAVPLVFGDTVLGAVTFSFRSARSFDDDDRRFLLALANQAAQALERARLHAAARDAARRQELLAEVSGLLATAIDPVEALGDVARLVTADFVTSCVVEVADGAAASVGVPIAEGSARLSIPLRARGNELGVMVLARVSPEFAAPDFALATELADRIAMAVDNARAHRAQAEQARTLQASLLPPRLPEVPGLTIDSRYQPIGDGSLVGGDFFDVFPLGERRWGFMIGDVCGQGVTAASLTALVRHTARAAARQWSSPADVLRFTNAVLAEHDLGERFCTLLLVAVDRDEHGARAVIASAGHHPPIVHRRGVGILRPGHPGSALGLFDDARVEDEVLPLESGDTIVLFTDGVIEAHDGEGSLVGDRFLEEMVEAHAADGPAAIGERVERELLTLGGGRSRDDVAMLIVHVGEVARPPVPLDRTLDERYAADPASVPAARDAVRAWLEEHRLVPTRADDIQVAVTELVTNAVRAARSAIEVRAWSSTDVVTVEVIDDGPGFDPSIPHDARELDPLADRGRGLFVVASIVDECTIESGPNGTIVRCAISR